MMSATRPPGYSQRTTIVSPRLLAPRKRPGTASGSALDGAAHADAGAFVRLLAAGSLAQASGFDAILRTGGGATLLPRLGAVATILRRGGQGRGGEQGGEDVGGHPGHGRRSRPQALNDG
jgi:hypothetical protein